MNQKTESKKPDPKKKKNGLQRELDKELEMTFPASDPLSVVQPPADGVGSKKN